ncbi:UTP--glucose-1-phosphate uridylyltransferase GalU [soil metagenome]
MTRITKAVIPAAGFGTRFLPQTKAMPKEMLPIVDKPVIQIVVEELVDAGIKDIIIVTGWHKRSIEDHFDTHPELEALLEKSGKTKLLEEVKHVTNLANFIYVRQKGPVGNATPIANCAHLLNDEPFIVCWGDNFFDAHPSSIKQMLDVYEKYGSSVLACIKTDDPEDTKKYGFAKGLQIEDGLIDVNEIVEKPGPDKVPSNLATISGLYTGDTLPYFQRAVDEVEGREPNYIDALTMYLNEKAGKVYAAEIKNGKYFDTGSKIGYLETIVNFGLKHPETKDEFKKYLETLNKEL